MKPIIAASPRISKLKNMYYNGPVFKENLYYYKIRRQQLNYMREYINSNAYTTRLRKAYAEAAVLEKMTPVIEDDELIVGKCDFSPLSAEEQEEFDLLSAQMNAAPRERGLGGHMVPDYPKLLRIGVVGILEEIKEYRQKLDIDTCPETDLSKDEFYEACEVELKAFIRLQEKYSKYALELAEKQVDEKRKAELLEISKILERVPKYPAKTFKEALQSIHFYHFSLWTGLHFGRVDQYLLPFYLRDIEEGRLTREEAQEWIDCFRLIAVGYMHPDTAINVMVGGRDPEGNLVENELTEMFLTSLEHIKTMHKVEFAICKETDDELIKYAIKLNAQGLTLPSLLNDDAITEAMRGFGYPENVAHNWATTGCVEITPIAKSGILVVSPYHNMPKMLLEAMNRDCDSFEELFAEFEKILRREVVQGLRTQNRFLMERSRNGMEIMRLSCLVDDCLKRGKSIDEGGACYNHIQPDFLGLANVADSFTVLNELVFKTGKYTLPQMREIVSQNFANNEELRKMIINEIAHYGNDDRIADAMVSKVTDAIQKACKGLKTYRGDLLQPGTFSYLEHARHGKETGATPDGRLANYPLSSGSGPAQGREVSGITAVLNSSTSWDHKPFLGGVAVNIKFASQDIQNEGLEKMLAIVRTFFQRGGFQLQINAVSSKTMCDAMENPEQYRDLIVRVGGFSANFVTLTKEMQQELIDRNEHSI